MYPFLNVRLYVSTISYLRRCPLHCAEQSAREREPTNDRSGAFGTLTHPTNCPNKLGAAPHRVTCLLEAFRSSQDQSLTIR